MVPTIPPISPRAVRTLLNIDLKAVSTATGVPVGGVERFEADATSVPARTQRRLADWYRDRWQQLYEERLAAMRAVLGE